MNSIDQHTLSLLLSGSSGSSNPSAGMQGSQFGSNSNAALLSLLSQHQQPQQQQPAAASSESNPSGLFQALMQHQQEQQQKKEREDQERALLLQKLKELSNPAPQATSPDDLALLFLQQKQQMQNPSAYGMMGSNPLFASNMSANFGAAPGQLDAATLAKLLGGQQAGGPSSVWAGGELSSSMGASASSSVPQGLEMAGIPTTGDRRRKGRTGTFPQKLHQMLMDLERQEGGRDIASFLPHGRAFAIHKPRDFVKHVMPKYFRMSRFSSFQRQLNLYDFQRITEGPDKGSYYHELFVQGRPILSTMMKRNKIKGVKNKNNGVEANTASATNVNEADDDDEGDEDM